MQDQLKGLISSMLESEIAEHRSLQSADLTTLTATVATQGAALEAQSAALDTYVRTGFVVSRVGVVVVCFRLLVAVVHVVVAVGRADVRVWFRGGVSELSLHVRYAGSGCSTAARLCS